MEKFLAAASGGFNWYGFLIAMGIAVGIACAYFAARYRGFDPDVVFDLCIWAVPLALVGARTYFVIFEAIDRAINGLPGFTFAEIFGFVDGKFKGLEGLAIYGGVIGAIIGCFINSRIYKKKGKPETFLNMLDLGAPFLIFGQAIGRWGNFANHELYGAEILNPSFQWFPLAVEVDNRFYQALFFYESFLNVIGGLLLLWFLLGKRRSRPGFVISMYAVWYGLVRFVLEGMRPDEFVLFLGPFRVSQLLSLVIVLVGVIFLLTVIYKARTSEVRIPLFVTREDWSKTGRDMFEWGRDPSTPIPRKVKEQRTAAAPPIADDVNERTLEADEESDDEDVSLQPSDTDASDAVTSHADDSQSGDTDETTGAEADASTTKDADPSNAASDDGFSRKKFAGKD